LTGLLRTVVEETLDYVLREMTAPEGGFYAAQDADSEGEEGRFFVRTPDQIRDALGGPATRFLELQGVRAAGNFEGKNILTFDDTFEERQAIAGARQQLFDAREKRVHPGRDAKVVTSWNGLMLAAFAEGARVLGREDYRQAAERNADFLLRNLRTPDGRLWHVWKEGEAAVPGFLEDYTQLIEGLLALYQTTFEVRWYTAAAELAGEIAVHFSVSDGGPGFYDTAEDAESLVVRLREMQDNAVPSGNAMAATVLQKLARFGAGNAAQGGGEAEAQWSDYEAVARRSLASMSDSLGKHPLAFGQWLVALDGALATPVEVAIVGAPGAEDARALLNVVLGGYRPHQLMAAGMGDVPPLLMHREQVGGKVTVYSCRNRVCRAPVNDVAMLLDLLRV